MDPSQLREVYHGPHQDPNPRICQPILPLKPKLFGLPGGIFDGHQKISGEPPRQGPQVGRVHQVGGQIFQGQVEARWETHTGPIDRRELPRLLPL